MPRFSTTYWCVLPPLQFPLILEFLDAMLVLSMALYLHFHTRKTHSSSHPHESGDIGSHGNGTSGTSTNGGFRRLVHDLRKGRGWFLAFIFAAHGCRNISSSSNGIVVSCVGSYGNSLKGITRTGLNESKLVMHTFALLL